MVIEFIGLPGAGKTTVADALLAQLKQETETHRTLYGQETIATNRNGKLFAVFKSLRTAKMWMMSILTITHFILNCPKTRLHISSIISVLNYYAHIIKHNSRLASEILILDHGIINYLWLICLERRRHSVCIDRMIKVIAQNSNIVYVYIKVDPNQAAHRVLTRRTTETLFDELEQDVNARIFASHNEYFDVLVSRLTAVGAPILTIDGSAGIDNKVQSIRQWLMKQVLATAPVIERFSQSGMRASGRGPENTG